MSGGENSGIKRERHVDTIGKQLADIKGKGVATLKRVAEASEGRIVMRLTDSGSRLPTGFAGGVGNAALMYAPRRTRAQSIPGNSTCTDTGAGGDGGQVDGDDSISVTTTTSDVNSEDDAASIVSRLSQIVVEQEEKLLSLDHQNQMLIIDNNESTGKQSNTQSCNNEARQRAASRPGSADCFSSPMGTITNARNNQLRPTPFSRARSRRSNSVIDQSQIVLPTGSGGTARKARHLSQDFGQPSGNKTLLSGDIAALGGQKELAGAHLSQQVPKIHVTKEKKRTENKDKVTNEMRGHRSRAQSVDGYEDDEYALLFNKRRDLSSAFLPERGDLKSLETIRKQRRLIESDLGKLTIRNRSNTFGSIDKTGLAETKDQVLLNIRRSAWTLSEFDHTFNKSGDKSISTAHKHSKFQVPIAHFDSQEQVAEGDEKLLSSETDKQSTSIVDSFVANGCVPANCDAPQTISASRLSVDFGAPNTDRRSSYNHSIISIATSLDSFCSDRNKLSNRKRRKKDKNNQEEGANFSDSSQPGERGDNVGRFRSCFNLTTLAQYVPIVEWLPAYKLSFLWGDLMAGMAVAVLNISTSLSAAVVAETDFSVAFRASIVNTFVYALLCSSRHTSFGSWSIMSQMLFISVRRALSDELILARLNMGPSASWQSEEYERWHLDIIIMYTFLIGLFQLVCGLLNLGKIVASFIPEALCSSMITATAFTMAVGQLSNMCGTSNKILWQIERNTTELWADLKHPPVDITDLFANLFRWIQQIALLVKYNEQINFVAVIISIISVFLLCLNQYVIQKQLERYFKRKIFIPSELILLVIMIIVSSSLNLRETYNIATCGPLHIDFVVPDWPNLRLIRELWFDSFATALISFTMVYVMAKTYSNKFNYEVDCNQELIACGAGNLIGGLCDALPATASFSRTAGQVEAGGQTQMASIINCIGLFVMARLLGQHVAELPVCVMAATLFYGFARMMTRFSEVFLYWRVCKVDFAIWMVTFIAILTLDIVNGFIYGFIFSVLTMLYRAQNRRCYMLGTIESSDVYVPLVKYPSAQEIEGIKIFQFCGPIHYVCADLFERLLRQKTRVDVKQINRDIAERQLDKFNPREMNLPTHIILDFSMISYIDSAGVHVIKKVIEDFQRVNITILLASLASHVAAVIKREPSLWNVYKRRFYITLADAVHYAMHDGRQQARVDQSIMFIGG